MPSYQYIDERTGVVVMVREGRVELLQDLALAQERSGDPGRFGDRPKIMDLRRMDAPDDVATIRTLAGALGHRPLGLNPARLAIVVAKPAVYGTARMFLALTHGRYSAAEVFYDWGEAANWLTGGAIDDPATGHRPQGTEQERGRSMRP